MPRAFPHTGPETINNWRYYRLEQGGPLTPDGEMTVVVSAFDGGSDGGSIPLRSKQLRPTSEVRIFQQGRNGRPRSVRVSVRCKRCGCALWQFQRDEER